MKTTRLSEKKTLAQLQHFTQDTQYKQKFNVFSLTQKILKNYQNNCLFYLRVAAPRFLIRARNKKRVDRSTLFIRFSDLRY